MSSVFWLAFQMVDLPQGTGQGRQNTSAIYVQGIH